MDDTTVPTSYDQPITYFGVAYTLAKEDTRQLASMDAAIQNRLGDILFFAPDGSRHITILNLTAVANGYKDKDTMRFFERVVTQYDQRLQDITSKLPPFELTLDTLEAHTHAIILRGHDGGQIAAIRKHLLDLPRLNGRLIEPGFIHSTQARYQHMTDLEQVKKSLSDINVAVPITVNKLSIVRADASFSQPDAVLKEYPLQST